MKINLLAALAAFLICVAPALAGQANVSCSTGSATCTLLANSATNAIVLHRLLLTLSTADNITLKCGSTSVIGPIYLGANSWLDLNLFPGGPQYAVICAPGNDLTITKGTSTTPTTGFIIFDQ